MLAERIGGIENPLLTMLMHHETPSTLPEPLRWCAVNGAFAAANRMDERLNRKVRTA